MQNESAGRVWVTVSYDRDGNVVAVLDQKGTRREPRKYGGRPKEPEVGDKCPEGEVEITAVKTIEIRYVTCANVNDPCWVYVPAINAWVNNC